MKDWLLRKFRGKGEGGVGGEVQRVPGVIMPRAERREDSGIHRSHPVAPAQERERPERPLAEEGNEGGDVRKRIAMHLLIALVFLGAGMGLYYGYVELVKSRWLSVSDVLVEGTDEADALLVVDASGIRAGASLLDIDEGVVARRVKQKLRWVKSIEVDTVDSTAVKLVVTYREASAIMVDVETCLVDADGTVFRVMRYKDYDKSLLVMSGLNYYHLMDEGLGSMAANRVRESIALASGYRTRGLDSFMGLSEIQFDEALGYSLVGEDGRRVQIGVDRHQEKLVWLNSIFGFLQSKGTTFDTVFMDNERRPEHVVVTGTGLAGEPLTLDMSNRQWMSARRPALARAEP